MKKIITSSFVILLSFVISSGLFAQQSNIKDYKVIKENFYRQYLLYKGNLDNGIFSAKPIDPNGLFKIDDNNNFAQNNSPISDVNYNLSQAPWINSQKDAVSGYTWAQSTSTYTSISGTGTLIGSNLDDDSYGSLNIGFTFTYNGVAYTQFGLNANGFISMGAAIPVSSYNSISSGSTNNVIACMNRDLYGIASGNGIYYQTTGTAPNRVLVVEWKNWGNFSSGLNEYNFQIQLFETTNKIAYVFGPCTPSTSTTMECAFRTVIGDYAGRAVAASTSWSSSTSGYLCNINSTYYPSNGLTWTWSPPPTGQMGYYSSNTNQLFPSVPIAPNSVNNQIIQIVINDTGVTSPLIVERLKLSTAGSNNPSVDIANAKLYYTRSSSTFSTALQYGATIASPNGVMNFTDTASLDPNAGNYFWLTYDISAGAVIGDSVDATCDSLFIGGTGYVPTVTAPPGSRPIDPYCLGTVSNAGCPYGLYITNVLFGSINNSSGCNGNMPYCYDKYTNLSTVVRQNNPYPIAVTNQNIANPNQTAFGIWIDWNNNNSFADGGEYFATTVIPANTTTSAYATITVPAGATLGNHRMRIRTNLSTPPASSTFCSNLSYGEQEDYTVTVIADTNMTYSTSTTSQTNTSNVYSPSNNTQIIGIQVDVFGSLTPISATSFSLNTSGSTNPSSDISKAKIWYTGASPLFATTTLVGTVVSPNGAFVISGSQPLVPGSNYFWLTYDVPSSAASNDTLDAVCNSVTVGGVARIPSPTSPEGFRIISGSSLCGNFTIPGSYPNFASAISDLNSRGICGPVTFTVGAGFSDTAANLVITATGTAANPITFKGTPTAAMVNPVIVAGVGTSTTTDGIIKISGGDYITFDGIDLQENPANVNTTTQMEWGYALVKPDGTNGCQNVTIKNCNITLNKTNVNTKAIYSNNHSPAATTTFVVLTIAGANSNNTFMNNTLSNTYMGIYINGYADAVPYTFYDQKNTVSGNNLSNFGGSSSIVYGLYNYYQNNLIIDGNNISGGDGSTSTLYGVYVGLIHNGNLTLSNNTVTLTPTTATTSTVYGIFFGAGSSGTTNTINVLNNSVQNCNLTSLTTGIFYGIYCNAISKALTISDNKVVGNNYGTAATTTGTYYSIYNVSASIDSTRFLNNLDSGNTLSGTTAYSLYRIGNGAASNMVKMTGNRIKNNVFNGTTATATMYGIYNTGGTFSNMISNNIVSDNIMASTSSASMYMIFNSVSSPVIDESNNTVSNISSSGTGTLYCIYNGGTANTGITMNNNTVSGIQKLTATGTGSIYCIYITGSGIGPVNVNNNTVNNITSAASTAIYGIYQIGSPPNIVNINGNSVGNLTNAGTSVIYGIYNNPTTTSIVTHAQDSIYNLTTAGGTIYGMYLLNGTTVNIYKNSISGITSGTTTTAVAHGIYDAISNAAATINFYNNIITDIKTPASTSIAPALSGIYIASGSATTQINAMYNTIYLNSVSTSVTTFGTAGIYALTTPVLNLRNNVIVNNSTPGPTGGQTVAYRRSSITLTTYSNSSNNNCFWAGTPAANRLIYFDGTNSDQTLAAYKTRVVPRDNNSVRELPPFINGTTPPYDLRINTAVPTQLESGGQQIISSPISVNDDKFGVPRYPNSGYPVGGFTPVAPDIGANEFGGLNADTVSPFISYTPLTNGGVAVNRAFNNIIITDASGVNTAAGTKPRCYYKTSSNANTINDNTSATDGWKYVEANGTTSPFDFTIDYTKVFGGSISAGQSIQYFVIAQDLATTSNVGSNQATFALAPASVNLAAANTPISNTLSYNVGANIFSGSYNVGTGQAYTSLTGANGLFAFINAGTVSGNITAVITSDMVEDGTNALNVFNETGPGGYTLTIVPATGSMKTISGAVANGMIRFNGSRRVIIDGNGGFSASKLNLSGMDAPPPSKYLTFRNTNTANPTFTFINDAVGITIKNCIIESANIGTASGTILFSTTTGLQGNDSNTIQYCDIRDRSDAAGTPANAIYSAATTTTPGQYNNFNRILSCNIFNNFYDAAAVTSGIYLQAGNSDWTIDSCSFYQTASRSVVNGATFSGIYVNSTLNNNISITNNYFGGTAPQCGSTEMTYSGTGAYTFYGIYLTVGNQAVTNVQGNTIKNIILSITPTAASTFFRGIYVPTSTSWVNIGNLSGNTIGAGTGTGSISLYTNTVAASFTLAAIHHAGFGSIMNSTIGSLTFAGNSAGTGDLYAAIYWANTTAGQIYTISNNLIGSLTTANSIQVTNLANGSSLRGMYLLNGAGTTNIITNNVVANLTSLNNLTTTTSSVYGIQQNSASNGMWTFTGNTVRNLINNTNALTTSFMLLGISSPATGINTFEQNNVYSLYANGTGSGYQLVGGFLCGGSTGGTVSKNKVYDLRFNGSGLSAPYPLILGINVQSTGQYTVSNNMVSLTNGDPAFTNPVHNENYKKEIVKNPPVNLAVIPRNKLISEKEQNEYIESLKKIDPIANLDDNSININKAKNNPKKGDVKNNPNESTINSTMACVWHTNTSPGAVNYYYNTFFVGGTQPGGGTLNSFAFARTSAGMVNLRNNLMINARIGGGGTHYVVGNEAANPLQGWNPSASNYNVFLGSNASTIGEWGLGNNQSIEQWVITTGGDNQSWSTTTSTIVPTNLLTNIGTCDLTVQSGNAAAWLVSGKGIALSDISTDFTGESRATTIAGGCTDIGADEFAATPPSNPTATQVGTPSSGSISNYYIYGRKVISIEWGVGGSAYPTSMNVNYYSGINPSPNITSPNRNSNSYWTVVPASGTLTGTTYTVTVYFGDNETYNITSPGTNTLLAKYNTFWQVFPAGSGNQFSQLDWNTLTVTTSGLNNFSTLALSDAALPSIVLVNPPNDTIIQVPSTTFVWKRSAGSTSHRLVVATDSTFASGIIKDTVMADTSKAISGLVLNNNYWWRVYGTNGVGTGAYSQIFKFTYKILLTPPPPPALFSPSNNATNQPVSLNLIWYKASTATSYRVQLSTDSTFGSGIIVNDSTLTDSVRAVSGLNYSTNYWWRVNAKNSAGTSAYSPVFKFTTGPLPPAVVNLKVIPGGFYNTGTGRLNMRDTIRVMLVDSTGCLKSDSTKAILDSVTFTASVSFSNAATGSYYMYVFHRNHIFISTRLEQSIIRGSAVNYDFTNDSTKAYGSIMIRVSSAPLLYGMIPGDANMDGFVDGLDQTIWVAQNGLDGYLSADFNGDLFVDGLDQTLWVLYNGQSYFVPCELTFENPIDHARRLNEIYNNQIEKIINPKQNNR